MRDSRSQPPAPEAPPSEAVGPVPFSKHGDDAGSTAKPPRPTGLPSARDCVIFALIPLLLIAVCFTPAWDWMQFAPFSGRGAGFAHVIQALQYDLGRVGFVLVLTAIAALWGGLAWLVRRKWQ